MKILLVHALLLASFASGSEEGICRDDECEAAGLLQLSRRNDSSWIWHGHLGVAKAVSRSASASKSICNMTDLNEAPDDSGILYKKFSVDEGVACLEGVMVDASKASEHISAWAHFWEELYVFAPMYPDPADSDWANFSLPVGVPRPGIYAQPGGGSYYQNEKVDVLGKMLQYADSLRQRQHVSLYELNRQSNLFWLWLRDAHTQVTNSVYQDVAGMFQLLLLDESGLVGITGGAADPAKIEVDSYFDWHFKHAGTGKRILKIDGKEPVQWIADNILKPPFRSVMRCLGSRMNEFLKVQANPVRFSFGHIGSIEHLNTRESFPAELEDGTVSTWGWRMYFSWAPPKEFTPLTWTPEGCPDTECVLARMSALINNYQNPLLARSQLVSKIIQSQLQMDDPEGALRSVSEATGPVPDIARASTAQTRSASRNPMPSETPFTETFSLQDLGFMAFDRDESGLEYAIFKLSSLAPAVSNNDDLKAFSIDLLGKWRNFTELAASKGVTRLVVDVVGNGGGYIWFAYAAVRMLFPYLGAKQVCNYYDTAQGPAAQAFLQLDTASVVAAVRNDTIVQQRFLTLVTNWSYAFKLFMNTRALVQASHEIGILNSTESTHLGLVLETLLFEPSPAGLKEALAAFMAAVPKDDVYRPGGAHDPKTLEPFIPSEDNLKVELRRGGTRHDFSKQFFPDDCMIPFADTAEYLFAGIKVPFTSIRFVSDGLCGSSCDTFTRTSYLLAKEVGLDVGYVTYGGLGGVVEEQKQYLSGTQFPGGSVNTDAEATLYAGIKKQLILAYILAFWLGLEGVTKQLVDYDTKIPAYPVFMNGKGVPRFTQMEVYYNAFGEQSLPGEFLFFPTDFTINDFFYAVSQSPWNVPELKRLYHASLKSIVSSQ